MITGTVTAIFALLVSFYITYKSIPVIIKVSTLKGLLDEPDGNRKLHKKVIPNLGGVGIFAGFIIAYSTSIYFNLPAYFPSLMAAITILFFVGIKDDILMIAPMKKLAGQLFAAIIVVYVGQIYVTGLDGFLGIYQMPVVLAKPLSVIAILLIINAYNLIDGVDGLAGMLSIVASYTMGIWFLFGGHLSEALLCFALSGSLVGFLFHNIEPARIFMGDTGSMIIGLLISVAAFKVIQINPVTKGFVLQSPFIFIFAIVSIPITDTLRLFFFRIINGKSPFAADRNHIHHCLLNLGLKHYQVALILGIMNVVILSVSIFIQGVNIYLSFTVISVLSFMIIPTMNLGREMLVKLFLTAKDTFTFDTFMDNMNINDIMEEKKTNRPHEMITEKHTSPEDVFVNQ